MYKPPFTITNKMLSLCISITEKVGQINNYQSLKRMPILRKNNKIKSIHSSLAIEANSLSLNQVKDNELASIANDEWIDFILLFFLKIGILFNDW